MTTHRYHPDPEKNEEAALIYDDCDRCDEQAANPFATLDGTKTAALWDRMVLVKKELGTYETMNERKVGARFYEVAIFMERLGVYPWHLYDELTRRYGGVQI